MISTSVSLKTGLFPEGPQVSGLFIAEDTHGEASGEAQKVHSRRTARTPITLS